MIENKNTAKVTPISRPVTPPPIMLELFVTIVSTLLSTCCALAMPSPVVKVMIDIIFFIY
jgi:hypothetical protein